MSYLRTGIALNANENPNPHDPLTPNSGVVKPMKLKRQDYGVGWAWKCNFGVCSWAVPSKTELVFGGKPSPEAVPVRVRLVPIRGNRLPT